MPDPTSMAHAGKEGILTLADSLFEYVVPIGMFVAGYFVGPAIGFTWSVSNVISQAVNQGGSQTNLSFAAANAIAGVISGGVWAVIGGAFWHMGGRGGTITRYVGRGAGALFWGIALGEFISGISNAPNQNGALSKLFGTFQSKITGLAPTGS